ncbi:MAG TPA: N-acetylglucosamine-6-phosphate deacetylase [Clostridium sp.]|nr:N-acetylglucosamine-6-phosphate deacetylase [Clostridia bacterium]HCW04224.1 N-acetylglucosamine-6-phosphate deacetylase [Clostridium sp.]
MIIKNAKVYLENGVFEKEDIYIRDDRFAEKNIYDNHIIDGEGLYAIPGLTDIHFHGCAGYDFCQGSQEALETMAIYQAENGITTICPATMTLDDEKLIKIFLSGSEYNNEKGATLVGINMEGPYLSYAKKGAQNPAFLKKPDVEHFRKMNKLSGNLIKLVTVAPEEEESMAFIKELKDEVLISIGHTNADYNTAIQAFKNGASHVTHLYNAMAPFSHRAAAVVGAAFDSDNTRVELICDGVHVESSVIRATFKLFGDDRIILVSDSMMATGMENGQYTLGGQPVTVKGNKATFADGTLAGSVTNLMECMQKAISFGIPVESAVKSAAVNPAKEIGIYDQYGSISPGKYANLVLLDKEFNVKNVILKGKLIK